MLMMYPQMRDRRLAAIEDAGHVRIHDAAPVVVPLRFHAAEPANPRVVHENIDPSLPPCCLVDERLHSEMIADISRKDEYARAPGRHAGELGLRQFEMILLDAADRDVHALLDEGRCNCQPDAARAARNNCDLALERIGHEQTI